MVVYREVYHLKRITESSKELKFNFDQQQWYELTQMIKTTYPNGKYRLKLTLEQNGQLNYVLAPLADKTFLQQNGSKISYSKRIDYC